MFSLNLLYYSLAIGFLILVGFLSYAAFNLTQTLKELNLILKRVDDITHDVEDLKNGVKVGFAYLKKVLARKGGDKNGSK